MAVVDLTKKIEADVRGGTLELKETVNGMTESLSLLSDWVMRVAKVERKGGWEGSNPWYDGAAGQGQTFQRRVRV